MVTPLKPYLSTTELIQVLVDRGMTVDEPLATQWLTNVGYYRLSGYWYVYRQKAPAAGQSRLDSFQSGTAFDDVASLYEFDRKLRGHMLDGLERVEIALRSAINEELGSKGPEAYTNPGNFRPNFDHAAWLDTARSRARRARRSSASIKHYDTKYGGSYPLWVLADHLDFADCSRLFEGLRSKAQWSIADRLGIRIDLSRLGASQQKKAKKTHPLVRWFEQLTIVRNTCAHHSRLWNRSFTPASTTALRTHDALVTLPGGQSENLYGTALVVAQLLQTISPGSPWGRRFRDLLVESLAEIPGREPAEVGCPPNWGDAFLLS